MSSPQLGAFHITNNTVTDLLTHHPTRAFAVGLVSNLYTRICSENASVALWLFEPALRRPYLTIRPKQISRILFQGLGNGGLLTCASEQTPDMGNAMLTSRDSVPH